MLTPPDESAQLLETNELIVPYMDELFDPMKRNLKNVLCDLCSCYVVDFTDSLEDCFYNLQLEANLGANLRPPPVVAILLAEQGWPLREGTLAVIRRVPTGRSWAFWVVQSTLAY